jgi:hypothetical protein
MMLGEIDEALSSTVVGGVAAVLAVVEVSVGEEDLVGAGETAAVAAEAGAEGAAGTGGVGTGFGVVECGVGSDGRTSDGRKDESRFLQRVEPLVGERFVVDWDLGKDTF